MSLVIDIWRHLVGLILAMLLFSGLAEADVKDNVYTFDPTSIYQVNPNTGASTVVYTFNPSLTSEGYAMAQNTDGKLSYIVGGTNGGGRLYTWDPASPALAPVAATNAFPAGVQYYLPRLAFDNNGVLWAMSALINGGTQGLYTVNTSTGVLTSKATFTNNVGPGGDIAFGPDGTLYMANATVLYTVPLTGTNTTIVTLGSVSGIAAQQNIAGLAFFSNDSLLLSTANTSNGATIAALYSVKSYQSGPYAATELRAPTTINSPTQPYWADLASAPRVRVTGTVYNDINADGTIDAGETGYGSVSIDLVDSAGVTVTTVKTAADGSYTFLGVVGGTYTVRVQQATLPSTGLKATLPSTGDKSVSVGTSPVSGVNFGFRPAADLAITKTDNVTSITTGTSTTYTVRVTNNGPSSATGAIVKDPAATGLTQTAAACTSGNACTTAPTPAALQGAGVTLPTLASGAFYEFTVTASVTAASGNVTNIATVAAPNGITDPTPGNNSASDTDTVTALVQAPNITLLKLGRNVTTPSNFTDSSGGATIVVKPGDVVEYCIVYKNIGGAAPNFKLIDNVPSNMIVDAQSATATQPARTGTLNAYATGKDIKWNAGVALAVGAANSSAVTNLLTNLSDSDQGTLTGAGSDTSNTLANNGQFGRGRLTLDLGAAGVPAGSVASPATGTVCFQTQVR